MLKENSVMYNKPHLFLQILFLSLALFALKAEAQNQNLFPGDIGAKSLPGNKTGFTVITKSGYFKFRVKSNWQINGAKGKPSISMMIFDMPGNKNSDKASIVIAGYHPASPVAIKAFKVLGKKYSRNKVHRTSYKGWKIYKQYCDLKSAKCKIIDATKKIADVLVGIRLMISVPNRAAANYERKKEKLLFTVLNSVSGKTGKYTRSKGETFRRMK